MPPSNPSPKYNIAKLIDTRPEAGKVADLGKLITSDVGLLGKAMGYGGFLRKTMVEGAKQK